MVPALCSLFLVKPLHFWGLRWEEELKGEKWRFFLKVDLFVLERQRERVQERTSRERGRGREPQVDSLLSSEPDMGLDSRVMS